MKKRREAWVAKNPDAAAPLLAKLNAGKITEADFWCAVEYLEERASRMTRIEIWLAKHGELEAEARPLLHQLEADEITEDDFWWLLGEQPNG